MEMKGEHHISAQREEVWKALNDTEILKASLPGCESMVATAENAFIAKITAKVGPVKAKFSLEITLSELDPPNGYTITGEGKGGVAGFANGGATVSLRESGNDTILSYTVKANVGGKLAQLGARLIDGAAKKMADEFFGTFSEIVGTESSASEEVTPSPAIDTRQESVISRLPGWAWLALLGVITLLGVFTLP